MPRSRRVYVSTDWWTDVDDAVMVRYLCWAQYVGLITIPAWDINTNLSNGPQSLDALLRFEGFRNSPISKPLTSHVPDGTPPYQTRLATLPADVGDIATVGDAVTAYRTKLASETSKVEILSVGYLNNLSELLASAADGISPLTGAQLVAQKVSRLWLMGGAWPTGSENNFNRTAQAKAAASSVFSLWPTPITLVGFEAADTLLSGQTLKGSNDPLALALSDHGSANGRPSWDIFAATVMLTNKDMPGLSFVKGTASVNPSTGANSWSSSESGPHEYAVKTGTDKEYQELWRGAINRTHFGLPF